MQHLTYLIRDAWSHFPNWSTGMGEKLVMASIDPGRLIAEVTAANTLGDFGLVAETVDKAVSQLRSITEAHSRRWRSRTAGVTRSKRNDAVCSAVERPMRDPPSTSCGWLAAA
jgi:hypothetical protein